MKFIHYTLILFVFFASFFALSSSCKKKKKYCTEGGTCRSVLLAKDFFLFKEGSWWVYEEETSHQRDSQYVYQYTNTSGYDFDMRVHSTLEDYDYHYWPTYASGAKKCSESEPVSGKCIFIKKSKGKIGDYIGEGECFFINFKIDDYSTVFFVDYPYNKIWIKGIYSNYNLNGNDVYNTIKIYEDYSLLEGKQPTNHFYTKNIGLIRKELLDSNQVWNLVNYHIEQ
ncbi:MAG: hypothetical protein IT221_11710 [Fluviicola sp.]|nr:hypothetical protein [Fluviicola sp.]